MVSIVENKGSQPVRGRGPLTLGRGCRGRRPSAHAGLVGERRRAGPDRIRSGTSAAVHQGLAQLLADGVDIDDERVQQLIEEHFNLMCLLLDPYPGGPPGPGADLPLGRAFSAGTSAAETMLW